MFCIVSIKNIEINNLKSAYLLMIGLFFYDIFWVFNTDVMFEVASNLKIPIKFIFIKTNGK